MYILTQFAGVTLPVGSPRHRAGTAPSWERTVRTLGGGVYDAAGTAQAGPLLPYDLTYDCKATGSSAASLRTTLDALRALRGVDGRLYRRALDDGDLQWARARLVGVEYSTEARHSHGLFQPLTMTWAVKTLWQGVLHGAPWVLDSGETLDSGLYLDMADRYALTTTPITLTVTNNGNTTTDDVTLTLEAGATPVTGLTVTCGACSLVFSGTVGAGKSLVIDCSPAAMSVLNDGAAAWADLALGGAHASEAWLRLAVGANSVVVTRTGGGTDSYLTVAFSDRWE